MNVQENALKWARTCEKGTYHRQSVMHIMAKTCNFYQLFVHFLFSQAIKKKLILPKEEDHILVLLKGTSDLSSIYSGDG